VCALLGNYSGYDLASSPVYKGRGQMSQNEVRKRREEAQVEIRRQKREENLAKRRNLYPSDGNGVDSDDEGAAEWESQVSASPQLAVRGDLASWADH
jgi:hypothetical protein